MLWEERMAAAARYRDAGNAAFRAGDAREALTQYSAVRETAAQHASSLAVRLTLTLLSSTGAVGHR